MVFFKSISLVVSICLLQISADRGKQANQGSQRTLIQDKEPHRLKITSASERNGIKDAFRTEFSTNGFPNVRTRYMDGGNGTERSISSFRTGLLCICEYNDTIAPNDSQNKIRLIGSKAITWSPIEVESNYNGTSVSRAYSVGTGTGRLANFSVTMEVFTNFINSTLGNKTLQPNATKISLRIKGFPYMYDRGKLSLRFAVWSKSQRAVNNTLIRAGASLFTWDSFAIADGKNVNITKLEAEPPIYSDDSGDDQKESNESHEFVTFGIEAERADSIYWDPEMIQGETDTYSPLSSNAQRILYTTFAVVSFIFNTLL